MDENRDGITKADILSWVKSFVWSGEWDAEEIDIMIEEQLGEGDEFDEDWLHKAVRSEFAAKRKAEKTWTAVTDCDRLDRAFQALERQGIIALHTAGFTQSDALEEVEEEYHELGGEKSNYAGHCYYTEQDQQGALDGSGMYIGYGHLSRDDAKGAQVGQIVRAALESQGFDVEWDGTAKTRLFVKGFRWQRRSPK